MLTQDFLAYLIQTSSATQAIKALRYAEATGYPTHGRDIPALLTAMLAYERRNRSISPEVTGETAIHSCVTA